MRRIKQTFSVLVLLQIILVNNALAHVNNIKHAFSCNLVDHELSLRATLSDEVTPCQQTESYSAITVSSSPPCAPPSVPSATVIQPTCTNYYTGSIVFDPQSVLYSIDDGATYQTSNVFSGITPGAYNLRVADLADISCSTAGGIKYIFPFQGPSIILDPEGTTINQNTNTYFIITARNAVSYQWQVDTGNGFVNVMNDANYSGATNTVLKLTNTPLSFNTYRYRCIAIGECSPSATSDPATLMVNPSSELDFAYDVDNGRQNISDGVPTTSPNVRLIPTNVGGTSYTVEVNTSSDFSGTSWSKTGTNLAINSFDFFFTTLPLGTTFYVRVSVDGGAYGATQQFMTSAGFGFSFIDLVNDSVNGPQGVGRAIHPITETNVYTSKKSTRCIAIYCRDQ